MEAPPIPPKSRPSSDLPPALPSKPPPTLMRTEASFPEQSARREFFESPVSEREMSPVRKTLTEISNSTSFASSDASSLLHTNGRSLKAPKGAGLPLVRSRSPSPSLMSSMSTMSTSTNGSVRELQGYVGFANIPNQVHRKAVKLGFDFTLMVVGASGLGKSTFINSLFLAQIYGRKGAQTVAPTSQVDEQRLTMEENGVRFKLTLVDTPGFGDQLDNTRCWEPIVDYVDRKYSDFFTEETKINRVEHIPDERVHACLYFIAPTGHGLKPLDTEFMKRLSERLNVIPVIAKADTLTPEEMSGFKKRVVKEIKEAGIRLYEFPELEEGKDDSAYRSRIPFAVIGSTCVSEETGRKVRCRRYPWGLVEVDNLEHNDFIALRNMLIRSHLIDLVDVTRNIHYENFRCRQLGSGTGTGAKTPGTAAGRDPFTAMAAEKKDHQAALKQKEKDMERVFREKVEEKESKLRNYEAEQERDMAAEETELKNLEVMLSNANKDLDDLKRQYPGLKSYNSEGPQTNGSGGLRVDHKSHRTHTVSAGTLDTSTESKRSHHWPKNIFRK